MPLQISAFLALKTTQQFCVQLVSSLCHFSWQLIQIPAPGPRVLPSSSPLRLLSQNLTGFREQLGAIKCTLWMSYTHRPYKCLISTHPLPQRWRISLLLKANSSWHFVSNRLPNSSETLLHALLFHLTYLSLISSTSASFSTLVV